MTNEFLQVRPLHVVMFQEKVLHFYYDIFILDEISNSQEHFIESVFLGVPTFHQIEVADRYIF